MSIKKLSKIRKNDPHFQREAAKYHLPLPSREYVLSELEKQGKPVSYAQLCSLMDIHESEEGLFQRRLAAMEREGQLMRNRKGAYILPERATLAMTNARFSFGTPDSTAMVKTTSDATSELLPSRTTFRVLRRSRVCSKRI